MCGFGCGNESSIIWIIILLCLCGNNDGCDNNWGDGNFSWIWILILLCCCCGNNNNRIGNNCGSC
ncbi:MAG: chorion class high-cysteine HCB protein 13 [Anaerotignum sp.]